MTINKTAQTRPVNQAQAPRPAELARPHRKFYETTLGKLAIVGGATVGLMGAMSVMDNLSSHPNDPTPVHSTGYLDGDKKVTRTVHSGQTGDSIAEKANHGKLTGQAELDAAKYVNDQGSITVKLSDGTIGHDLFAGDAEHKSDMVKVPIMSDAQIDAVNNGDLGNS